MSDQWLTIIEYARAFNVSDMTVRRRIRNGKLQAVLKEGKYFIPLNQESELTDGNVATNSPVNSRPTAVVKNHPMSRSTLVDSNLGFQESTGGSLGSVASRVVHQPVDQGSYSQSVLRDSIRTNMNKPSGHQRVSPSFVGISQKEICNTNVAEDYSRSGTADQAAVISANNLIEFCQAMAKRLDKSESSIRGEYDAKLRELQATAKNKDLVIRELRQKVEDLQLLVNIIDQNR